MNLMLYFCIKINKMKKLILVALVLVFLWGLMSCHRDACPYMKNNSSSIAVSLY